MLSIDSITISRGGNRLFSDLSLHVFAGELLVISGGNGVGKSSLLAAMVGLLSPVAGRVETQEAIFYLGHKRGLRLDLSVLENLQQDIRYVFNASILSDALQACGLLGLESRLLRTLSAGQQQRVALAKLWFSQAPLWVLDEPLEALDADMRLRIEAKIQAHRQQGGAAVVATHIPLTSAAEITQELKLGECYAV